MQEIQLKCYVDYDELLNFILRHMVEVIPLSSRLLYNLILFLIVMI